ncbi:TPA: hypothetical protein H1016_01150 [archaeon]|uniref:Uncharacterized protein n=1 Tax=Candidatus Naiadarchaeum limnaeum TaxID=2756139 RepID=A0A832XGF5_9ARCH|nr:hypothetical protein [Candidatus Naiadarchaeum limnaeum]
MGRSTILEITSFVLIIAGLGIFFYLYPPDFKQILVAAAILLIVVGIFVGIGGAVASMRAPQKGTPMS